MRDYADAAAHNAIPEEFLGCLLTRRHSFPITPRREEKVRIVFDGGETADFFESVDDCKFCGTTRTLWRDRLTNRYVHATYDRPAGYDPPAGLAWDRAYLWEVYRSRHPVKGRTRVVNR